MEDTYLNPPSESHTLDRLWYMQAKCAEFFRLGRVAANRTILEVSDALGTSTEVVEKYESGEIGIPLDEVSKLAAFLEISPQAIMNLFHELESGFEQKPSAYPYIHFDQFGELVRVARQTLDLSQEQVGKLMSDSDCVLSEELISSYECGTQPMPAVFWFYFCEIALISPDEFPTYSRWTHLRRIQGALLEGHLPFPASACLQRSFQELEKVDLHRRHQLKIADRMADLAYAFGVPLSKPNA